MAGPQAPPPGHSGLAKRGGPPLSLPAIVDLEIRIAQAGWRWKLQIDAEAELWTGAKHLGSLRGDYLVLLVANELNRLALMAYFHHRLEARPDLADGPKTKPPAKVVSRATQDARRAKRRARG